MLPKIPVEPVALFLDVDGTLLDIAAVPDGVRVPPELNLALSSLDKKLDGAIALVSGRSIADLDAIFAPLRLATSGVHGAEMRFYPTEPVEAASTFRLAPTLIAALQATAGRHPGTLVEDKGFSVAIHYRAAPALGAVLRHEIEALLHEPDAEGCRILPGHMVFEVKHAGFDKGTAVDRFMSRAPFEGRRPIFVGDDVTDLPGFDRAIAHGGLAYSVTTARDGTSGHFADPEAVRTWLSSLSQSLAKPLPS
ncbi:trehalose-phosphatase [Lichenihabitans sp. Uapishka_5]|uniref:trehalose-phosphatase n=1 Tax=Lichenihabitans sp. Uapishka_5 TaxID=3037302 RepID=UPI0029E7D1E1|nr:trehalose-phosphatase [Lichenihabitans sp. Uapishka_5]MDX7950664.1 trehalose-phosphatase [Lichenihabitans sp. Uapishka_5]